MSKKDIDPSEVLDLGDPGDETQRNFRYQNAIGAIHLIAGASGARPYTAVWCEHHEDLLCEMLNGNYDAIQVKTSKPENGYWHLNDDEVQNSIKRFVKHEQTFSDKIETYIFYSNTSVYTPALTSKPDSIKRSPLRFIEVVHNSSDIDELKKSLFADIFDQLAVDCECEPQVLFTVLKKTHIVKGPSRDDFDAVIAHDHLPHIEECKTLPKASLSAIRDEIVQQIFKASSLFIEDQSKYLLNIQEKNNPILLAKRVSVDIVFRSTALLKEMIFRYQPVDLTLDLKSTGTNDVLEKKFIKANLTDQLQTMKRRKISSESRLLELQAANPEKFQDVLTQLESIVQAECDEAKLEANIDPSIDFGPEMLKNVLLRLKTIAGAEPQKVYNEKYEMLVGIAALLTEHCSVWWSEKFNLMEAA
ncbi:MAG TPA: dsDNA nuclease domain-containing protein [Ferruginibacter sp.]|nr:dsDNA nuclease domain-containing protein [Ferruginibacter sp.]